MSKTQTIKDLTVIEFKELITDTVMEVVEDMAFGKAIITGDTSEYVDNKEFLEKLDRKIKG